MEVSEDVTECVHARSGNFTASLKGLQKEENESLQYNSPLNTELDLKPNFFFTQVS